MQIKTIIKLGLPSLHTWFLPDALILSRCFHLSHTFFYLFFNFLFLDSVWTERWLATADVTDNYRGYEECDVTKRAGNIKEGSLTVVHGTGDLGVHYHHAMLMSSTLVQAGILFNQIVIANDNLFSRSCYI